MVAAAARSPHTSFTVAEAGLLPEQFGRYRLDELIGRGGMGEVYRAYDTEKERVVAVKRLPPFLATDAASTARIRRESKIAGQLREPHVIPIHDYGEIRNNSSDSRATGRGPVPVDNVIGQARFIVLPLGRFGGIEAFNAQEPALGGERAVDDRTSLPLVALLGGIPLLLAALAALVAARMNAGRTAILAIYALVLMIFVLAFIASTRRPKPHTVGPDSPAASRTS